MQLPLSAFLMMVSWLFFSLSMMLQQSFGPDLWWNECERVSLIHSIRFCRAWYTCMFELMFKGALCHRHIGSKFFNIAMGSKWRIWYEV